MSFGEKPVLSGRQKFGCAVVAGIGILITGLAAILAALGSCPDCKPDPFVQFMLLPGIPVFFIGVGILMIWSFVRDKY